MRVKDQIALDIGFDMRRYGHELPADEHVEIVKGWKLAENKYGKRCEKSNYAIHRWLQSRRSAFKRGIYFSEHITPDYLMWLVGKNCPVTSRPMAMATGSVMDASFDRVLNEYGYVHGNLVAMSIEANKAKGSKSLEEVKAIANEGSAFEGLSAASWQRMKSIMEHVENSIDGDLVSSLEGQPYHHGLLYSPACQMQAYFIVLFSVSDDPQLRDSENMWELMFNLLISEQKRISSKKLLKKLGENLYQNNLQKSNEYNWEHWSNYKSRKLFFKWWNNLTATEKDDALAEVDNLNSRPGIVTESPTTDQFRLTFDMDSPY